MFRKEFDEKISQVKDNANLLSYLAKRLMFFYSHPRDVDRIVSINVCRSSMSLILLLFRFTLTKCYVKIGVL